ncbi:hypothetical protein [uncultured Rhodoblastus sp.]|uniref:hypothetical protein n=1 Tax=uncultured Rhodoblastus sp. TaxID=543037 RepID=UPI0025ECCBD2|nr:hypothetical protein [uncultured Rhodoblastus sp.]
MKKIGADAILIAAFAAICAWPTLASRAPSVSGAADQIELAEADPAVAEHASYAQKARDEVREWRVEIDRFGDKAKARSAQAWNSASEDLNAAWLKTREASDRLEKAGAERWDSARASYREAADALAAKWTKVRADLK